MEAQLILALITLLFLLLAWYVKKKVVPHLKGHLGELSVSLRLKSLSKKDYIVLNDVLLKIAESSTQIDHIVISKTGIYVIETKHLKGWIHGHENSEYWKQTIFHHKYRFKNPIKQNNIHVHALKKVLSDYPQIEYYPIVVLTGSAVLKNLTNWSPVIYSNQLIRVIRESDKDITLSFDQMARISDQLNRIRLRGKKENKAHVRRIKKKEWEELTKETCPKCGNYLIKRKGRFGEFYGCSAFPKCTYSRNIVAGN